MLSLKLPVLLTSGYTAQRVIPETPAGKLTLLKKPFSQADLSVAIRNSMAVPLETERRQVAKQPEPHRHRSHEIPET